MRKITSLALLGIGLGSSVFAKQVDVQTAQEVAKNFIATQIGSKEAITVAPLFSRSEQSAGLPQYNTYHVFSVNNNSGFVVVAGDDIVKPILAYSTNSQFMLPSADESPETKYWMGLYNDQVYYAINHDVKATDQITAQWNQYLSPASGNIVGKPTNSVAPMVTTTWNQGTNYNIYTPGTGSGKTPVGCVATAMAQIMKYWNAPTTGTGSYSYSTQSYGTLSADFGATTYEWSLMPNNLTSSSSTASKEAVSLLGYHCAIAVKMNFAPGGSGSQVISYNGSSTYRCAENAFKNHFGYKNTIQGEEREDYTDSAWVSILKNELDNARPILYAGFGQSGGHAFVFDGYDASDMFHINWGWGGMSDGYFTVDNLAPSALGIGGGGGNFNYGQQAVIKIEPLAPGQVDTISLAMTSALSISQSTIEKGEAFTVTADLKNIGQIDYSGLYQAQVYNAADSTPAIYFSRLYNQALAIGQDSTIEFATNGIANLNAGEYFIRINYRNLNDQWVSVGNGTGDNFVTLTVTDEEPNGIDNTELLNSISIYPNPANDRISVDLNQFSGKATAVQLFNIQGQKVAEINATSAKVDMNVSQLSEGMYFLRINSDKGLLTKKVSIKH